MVSPAGLSQLHGKRISVGPVLCSASTLRNVECSSRFVPVALELLLPLEIWRCVKVTSEADASERVTPGRRTCSRVPATDVPDAVEVTTVCYRQTTKQLQEKQGVHGIEAAATLQLPVI